MRIAHVRITGVPPLVEALVRGQIATVPGMTLAEAPFAGDVERAWAAAPLGDVQVLIEPAAGAADVTFALTPPPLLDHVTIAGIPPRDLPRIAWLSGGLLDRRRLERLVARAHEAAVRAGHLDATYAVAYATPAAGHVDVCVAANPGPRFTIGQIGFPGRSAVPETTLLAALRGKSDGYNTVGGLYDPDLLEEDRFAIERAYMDAGFVLVKLRPTDVRRTAASLFVTIPVEEGPQFRLGSIDVKRLDGTTAPALGLGLASGAVFEATAIAAVRDQLVKQLGHDVLPMTKVDIDARRVNVTFEETP